MTKSLFRSFLLVIAILASWRSVKVDNDLYAVLSCPLDGLLQVGVLTYGVGLGFVLDDGPVLNSTEGML